MNKDNVLAVADAIEQHSFEDLGFNMDWLMRPRVAHYEWRGDKPDIVNDNSGHMCGTVACIAGWANRVERGVPIDHGSFLDAQAFLELNDEEANELFYAELTRNKERVRLEQIKPSQAVAVLRHFAKTGTVDWSRAA